MKPQVRERALRSIVAALLGSGLSARDIRETASLLTSDPDFATRFMAMLDAVLRQLPSVDGQDPPALSTTATSKNNVVDEVLRILEPIRITKKELVAQLQSHRALADWQPNLNWSRRRIIESLVQHTPRSELPDVLAAVTVGRGSEDPWMEALTARGNTSNGSR